MPGRRRGWSTTQRPRRSIRAGWVTAHLEPEDRFLLGLSMRPGRPVRERPSSCGSRLRGDGDVETRSCSTIWRGCRSDCSDWTRLPTRPGGSRRSLAGKRAACCCSAKSWRMLDDPKGSVDALRGGTGARPDGRRGAVPAFALSETARSRPAAARPAGRGPRGARHARTRDGVAMVPTPKPSGS